MAFNTLMKKTIKINMSVLVTFVQSTMDIVYLASTTQNAKPIFRSISSLFDSLILAFLAREQEQQKRGRGMDE